ncbi:MAG: manganese efflux pump MntP family protein [Acidobacteriota bacterium]|jgi:Predicted membrane protein|nr:manganese efflux pump [Acidobacteriota bacterium]HNQ81307.1 manganese efflux pump MntP family protein [Candidatus Aminicenantes bacterium]MDD8011633.1 manganese efflux pump MntP family protein [Acidobacteriota bacterium]MDD8029668.1 manganese efflux pump MntP family protein [Acidobacteriota bacterium]MDD8032664.1 manganese efflux pump MntP family protein [Acidobacteriota bacterium]
MSFGVLLALALAMAMDTFAVAIGVSLVMKGCTPRQTFRLAGSFGSFQFLMPLLGWTVGRTVVDLVRGFDHWLAAGLLAVVAGKMIVEALEKKKDGKAAGPCPDKTRGGHLLLLSLATSIDALAVGLSLAALNVSVVYPAAVIGLVTFVVSAVGTKIGPVLGRWAGKSAELAGALVLLAIAAKILVEHLS